MAPQAHFNSCMLQSPSPAPWQAASLLSKFSDQSCSNRVTLRKGDEFLPCNSRWRAPGSLSWKPGSRCFARLEGQAMQSESMEPEFESGSGSFVGIFIEKALQAFLRTQLEQCGELKISVAGKNQELLLGQVSEVRIHAKGAVYKGLTLTKVSLQSRRLQLQVGSMKPLLQPFIINACIQIHEQDLNASLSSPLLVNALTDIVPPHWNWSRAKLSVALLEGLVQLQNGMYVQDLVVEIKDGGTTVHVCCVERGIQSGGVERRIGMSGVNISKLDVDRAFISITGDFTVTP